MKKCPRCASELPKFAKACPRCGLPVSQMEEFIKRFNLSSAEDGEETAPKLISKEEKRRQKQEEKKAKKQEKKEKKERESVSDTDFTKFTNIDEKDELNYADSYQERKRKRKLKQNRMSFGIDAEGKVDINTEDVEIVGSKTGKIIDERFEQSYSVKKSRGDYIPPKIKWWEIYKLADRYFARRKIKKQVSKAARIKPSFIQKSKLLLLAIFFGWTGAHNFYAKNKRKGWVSLICLFIWMIIGGLGLYNVPFFSSIYISVAGTAGFITLFIWITDIVNICFNKFKYRLQIDKFISDMNVETRAKLGEKYIDLELYHSPWWNRLKVWWQRKRKNYAERKRDRRQANIDKQKRKEKEAEEKAKIEREIYDFEQKQNSEMGLETSYEPEEKNAKSTLKSENSGSKQQKSEKNDKNSELNSEKTDKNSKKLKNSEVSENVSNETETDSLEKVEEKTSETETNETNQEKPKKKVSGSVQTKKYAKTVKNTKAAAKKKKKK